VTIWVEEFANIAANLQRIQGIPQLPVRNVTQVSSGGAVSTINLDQNTHFVVITNTAPSGFFIYNGTSTASTAAGSTCFIPGPESNNGSPIQIVRGVNPNSKLFVWST
jgi:hypothetical protein